MNVDNLIKVAQLLTEAKRQRDHAGHVAAQYEEYARQCEERAAALLKEARLEALEFLADTRFGLGSGKDNNPK